MKISIPRPNYSGKLSSPKTPANYSNFAKNKINFSGQKALTPDKIIGCVPKGKFPKQKLDIVDVQFEECKSDNFQSFDDNIKSLRREIENLRQEIDNWQEQRRKNIEILNKYMENFKNKE